MNEERDILNVILEITSGRVYHRMPVDHNRPSVSADVCSTIVEELNLVFAGSDMGLTTPPHKMPADHGRSSALSNYGQELCLQGNCFILYK
jgi:hypothetical protein